MATNSNISSEQEILNNANMALSAAVIQCKKQSEKGTSWGDSGGTSEDARNWAEAAYYLSQVIKDLEK